jgi:enoyl-CoA hydratase
MDMMLTGRVMDAVKAERANLVSRVFPADQLVPEAPAVRWKSVRHAPHSFPPAKIVGPLFQYHAPPLGRGIVTERA